MGNAGGPAAYVVRGTWDRAPVFERSPAGAAARDVHDIAGRLRTRRRRLGLTQVELAEKAGVAVRSVHQLENGSSWPSTRTLGALASVLEARLGVFQTRS